MSALTIADLEKSFGGLRVTRAINLDVAPGERRLIIGPNGAGKTTLFNLITGDIRPDSGSITLFGQELTRVASRRRAHLGLSRTYQIITLFPKDTLLRNVMLSLLGRRSRCAGTRSRASTRSAIWSTARMPRSIASAWRILRRGRCRRPPTASVAASRSRWRWRRTRNS